MIKRISYKLDETFKKKNNFTHFYQLRGGGGVENLRFLDFPHKF